MINEHQGGEVCRSPTSPPSKDGLRIGPGRAPPRILRGTRPGCSAAAAAASEHSGLLAPVGPLRSAFRPPARLRCSLRRCLRPGVAPGLRLPPAAAPAARAGPRRGPLGLACRRLRSPAAQAAPAPRPPRCGSGCGPARRGPSSRGAVLRVALGLLRARCARPPRRCGLPSALSPARCGRGPPSAAPAGAARRLRRRLPFAAPPRGLWRGFAPLSQAPGPAAGGVGAAAAAAWLPCGSRAAPPLAYKASLRSRPAKAGPAYMRTATLSHLLTRRACPPGHRAMSPLAGRAATPPVPCGGRDSGASAAPHTPCAWYECRD